MGNVSLIGSVSKTSATVTPSASVNVKNGKWTFSANSNLSASPKSYFDTGETTDYANGDRYTTDTKMDLHKSLFGYGMAGIYFDPDARNSLGIEVAYNQFLSPSDVTTNAAFNHTDIGIETMNGNYMSTSRHRNIDATFNYVHRLDSIGSQMKVIANYNHTKDAASPTTIVIRSFSPSPPIRYRQAAKTRLSTWSTSATTTTRLSIAAGVCRPA